MLYSKKITTGYPIHYPMNFSGKLTTKIIIKDDYVRANGLCALYLQVFLNKDRKRFPCDIAVRPEEFDKVKQRVKANCKGYADFNLILEKMLADINKIEVSYRLSNIPLTMARLEQEFLNPTSRLDFCQFWEDEMEKQKLKLKFGTYRQQVTMLNKLRSYRSKVFFYDINEEFLDGIKSHFRKKLKNTEPTINTFVKSFKKYLKIAQKKGIITQLDLDEVKVKQFRGNRTFLMPEEIRALHSYWNLDYVNAAHKSILAKFLFCCFTGLRFADVNNLTEDNFIDDVLVFSAEKTSKLQRITLNRAAREFSKDKKVFRTQFTNEYTNRELKVIASVLGIRKQLSFHIARHTFATNFLISGGRLEHLQKLLAHSNIRETLIYVHIVESLTDQQILNMDEILIG